MSDFHAKKSSELNYKPLADSVKNYKETEEGQGTMCKAVELYAEKKAREAVELYAEKRANQKSQSILIESALKMIARGKLTLAEIAEDTGLSLSVIEALAQQKRA